MIWKFSFFVWLIFTLAIAGLVGIAEFEFSWIGVYDVAGEWVFIAKGSMLVALSIFLVVLAGLLFEWAEDTDQQEQDRG